MGDIGSYLATIWRNAAAALTDASADGWIQALFTLAGIVVATVTFAFQQNQANALQRKEVYQRLELASNDLFRFEAEHAATIGRFRDLTPSKVKFTQTERRILGDWSRYEEGRELDDDADARTAFLALDAARSIIRKCYEQTLNLFEMAARLRAARIVEPDVFGSWVVWLYECHCEWAFRDAWPGLKLNYTAQLRQVFDDPVRRFDPAEDDDARRRRFFRHVAQLYRCRVVEDWLDQVVRDGERPARNLRP